MKKPLTGIIMLFFLFFSYPVDRFADLEDNVGFTIQAEIPENQLEEENYFFDLRMTENQTQRIYVQITNSSNEMSSFKVSINQGYTNTAGFIDYALPDGGKDRELLYPIDEIVSYQPEVTVEAGGTYRFPIDLKMGPEVFDGQILAGIQVVKEIDTKEDGISNSYGYILGLKLTETDNEVPRELKLLSVKPAASFSRTSVVAQLENPTMDAFGYLKYDATVKNKKTGKVEKTVKYDEEMQIAPDSLYDFAIDWDERALVSGEYTLDLTVSDAKENVWNFKEDFTISNEEAEAINKVTIDQNRTNSNAMIWLVLLLVLLIFVLLILLFLKKKKDEPKESDNNEV